MTNSQDLPLPFICPRCGGEMYMPYGSSFYWHATKHHPPCNITNVLNPHHLSSPPLIKKEAAGVSQKQTPML